MESVTCKVQFKSKPLETKQDEEEKAKQARRRSKIIKEIMDTELTYHRHLKLMADYFEIPMRAQKLLPNATISVVFSNIQQLIQVNNELRRYLDEMEVGCAFLHMGHFLKLYSVYAKNHQLALTTLEEVESKHPDLIAFRKRQEDRPEVQMKLNSLLITPVQRVPRYKLLLDELLACTPTTHTDYVSLKKAVKQISTVASHINDHIREHENFQKMIEIQKCLEGGGAPKIVAPGRRFIKEGILKRMSRNGGRSYERMFFLFSDMIIYAKPKPLDNGNHHYSCCCVLPLHHCSVENMFGCNASKSDRPMSPDDRGGMFRLSCKEENLLLFSENKETVFEWMKSLQDAISEVKQSRQTLRKESSAKQPMRRSALQRQWRREKMKKAGDETFTDGDVPKTKVRTPIPCHKESPVVIKYRKVLKYDDGPLGTPKKRLKLGHDCENQKPPSEDSFELLDDPRMDDFNVTLPRFFKQLSYNDISKPEDTNQPDKKRGLCHPRMCGDDTQPLCTRGLDGESVKCDTGLDTLKRLKHLKTGQALKGSMNKSLTRFKKRIRIPLPRNWCKSESAAMGNETDVSMQPEESSADDDVFVNDGDEPRDSEEPIYEEINFLPPPDLSLPPMSLPPRSPIVHPTYNVRTRRHSNPNPHDMSTLHLQNINNQPAGLMSSILQPQSLQPQSLFQAQHMDSLQQRSSCWNQPEGVYDELLCSDNDLAHQDDHNQPLSLDYLSVNSAVPRELSMGHQNLRRTDSEIAEEADKLSFYGESGNFAPRTRGKRWSDPENNFHSLPPVLTPLNINQFPRRFGRSVSCSHGLTQVRELYSIDEADQSNQVGSMESGICEDGGDDTSSDCCMESNENNIAVNNEHTNQDPTSATTDTEARRNSCVIL